MQSRVVTAPQSKNSSGMSSRFKPHEVRLLPSLQMDQSLHGAIQDVVVIALNFKNSSGMYSTFSPLHELGSQQMHMQAAPPFAAILANGSIVTWGHPEWGGDSSGVQEQLRMSSSCQAHKRSICCNTARWICHFMGLWRGDFKVGPKKCPRGTSHRQSICGRLGRPSIHSLDCLWKNGKTYNFPKFSTGWGRQDSVQLTYTWLNSMVYDGLW